MSSCASFFNWDVSNPWLWVQYLASVFRWRQGFMLYLVTTVIVSCWWLLLSMFLWSRVFRLCPTNFNATFMCHRTGSSFFRWWIQYCLFWTEWHYLNQSFLGFLAATKQLYKWYFPSVRLSVCPSVCHTFFTMFPSSYHHEIFRSYYHGQKWCPCKRSRSEVKGQGHRGQHPT